MKKFLFQTYMIYIPIERFFQGEQKSLQDLGPEINSGRVVEAETLQGGQGENERTLGGGGRPKRT